jgi:hypothetical protein
MAAPFATPGDVAARWRPLTAAELVIATALLGDASALLRSRFPGIDAQVANGNLDAAIPLLVVAGMVKRALIAPDEGVTSESESAGPYNHSQTFANPLRNVFLTAADLVLIQGYIPAGGSHRFANTTDKTSGYYYPRTFGW